MNLTPEMIETAARVMAHRDVFNADRWREYAEDAESALIAALSLSGEPVNVTPEILDADAADAATINGWSDRNPATIIKRTAKTITVQRDNTAHMSGEGHDAYANGKGQVTVFTRDAAAPEETYTLRSNGRWIRTGQPAKSASSLTIGTRDYYRDPSF
jgi:hypothetical protein